MDTYSHIRRQALNQAAAAHEPMQLQNSPPSDRTSMAVQPRRRARAVMSQSTSTIRATASTGAHISRTQITGTQPTLSAALAARSVMGPRHGGLLTEIRLSGLCEFRRNPYVSSTSRIHRVGSRWFLTRAVLAARDHHCLFFPAGEHHHILSHCSCVRCERRTGANRRRHRHRERFFASHPHGN